MYSIFCIQIRNKRPPSIRAALFKPSKAHFLYSPTDITVTTSSISVQEMAFNYISFNTSSRLLFIAIVPLTTRDKYFTLITCKFLIQTLETIQNIQYINSIKITAEEYLYYTGSYRVAYWNISI